VSTLIVGCGYLGERVGKILLARGEPVSGTVRSPARAGTLATIGIEPVIADVLAPQSLAALPDADRVLYCVGLDRTASVPMRTVCVDGLRNVLARLQGRYGRLAYVSSTGVYGRNEGGFVSEDDPAEPVHESGRVVLDAEQLLRPEGAIVLRCSGLYGPGRIPGRASLERGEPIPGDPSRYLNLIHIDDAATAVVAALDRGERGRIYHLSDDRPVERREYYGRAAALLGAPPPHFAPPAPGGPAALREESSKRISNRRLRNELGVILAYPDIETGLPAALEAERDGAVF
jgi:nucleoside-diphosphate-sugar epimerase